MIHDSPRVCLQTSADYEPMDLTGAFVQFRDFGVAKVSLDGIVLAVSVPTEDLYCVICGAAAQFAGEQLGHRRLGRVVLAVLL